MIHPREEIEGLVAFEGRGPGSDAERRAAQHLRARLEAMDRDAELEATWIRPNWPLAYTGYVLLGIVASVVSTASPVAGIVLAAIALLAAIADLSGRLHTGRRLTGRRGSQNVISREGGDRPGTLVLVAHYDAGHSGFAYGPLARAGRRIGPFRPLVLALTVILATAILRQDGIDHTAVSIVQFAATIVLIVALPLLVDIALSSVVPGANDNAAGVATVLRLAERYGNDLEHFDVWVLLTGGEEALGDGMREWVRRHRRELDATSTVFLNVDTVGIGTVRYTRREGPVMGAAPHPRLVALAAQIAEEDAEQGRYQARPLAVRAITDALAARRSGFPAITITCRDEDDTAPNVHRHSDTADAVDDAALERVFGFCSELIELIDEDVGPDIATQAASRERFRAA